MPYTINGAFETSGRVMVDNFVEINSLQSSAVLRTSTQITLIIPWFIQIVTS